MRRRLFYVLGSLLGLFVVLAALAWAAVKTEPGTRLLLSTAMKLVPGLRGDVAGGTLAEGVTLRGLQYQDAERDIQVDEIDAKWRVNFRPLALTIDSLQLGELDVALTPGPDTPPSPPPRQLTLPFAVDLRAASISVLNFHRQETIVPIKDIRFSAKSDRVHHELHLDRAATPWGVAQTQVRIDGSAPVKLDATASLDGRLLDEPIHVDGTVSGALEALSIELKAQGEKLSGHVEVAATPFAPVPFSRVNVMVEHFNPQQFLPSAPRADLTLEARLLPSSDDALSVSGPVSLRNAIPGPLDRQRLPVTSMRAHVLLVQERQQLTQIQVALSDRSAISGEGTLEHGRGQLRLQVRQLNLRTLYTPLQATSLNGAVTTSIAGPNQRIELELSGQPMALSVAAKADITPEMLTLQTARLQSGPSVLQMTGTLSRDRDSRYAVKGSLADFDPARFINSVQAMNASQRPGKRVDAAGKRSRQQRLPADIRINMDFSAAGKIKPELEAQARFAIHDSTYDRLPMSGQGTLFVQGKRLMPSEANISIAGNAAQLNGSFGRPGDIVNFRIDAPALDRLGLGVTGKLSAGGRLAGSIESPQVDAQWEAAQLGYGDYQLERATGEAHLEGLLSAASNGRLRFKLDATRVRGGPVALASVRGNVEGTYGQHTISLETDGQLRGQALKLRFAAAGGVTPARSQNEQPAWSGTIQQFDNRGFPEFSMLRPTRVRAAAGSVEIGATRLTVERASIALADTVWRPGLVKSAGELRGLNVGHLLALQKEFTGQALPVSSNLVLNGEWNVTWAERAAGFVQLIRQSGDVSVKVNGRDINTGIEALRVRGDLEGNRIRVDAGLATARLGRMTAVGTVGLTPQPQQMTLGPESTLALRVQANIAQLENVASLAGPRVALKGRTDADVAIKGTVAKPSISGSITAQDLALTLYDQGVRLQNGSAKLALHDNIVELREVIFHGGDGTLRATGSFGLDSSNPTLAATIVADRLQLIADPSRQLTLSGQALASNPDGQLKISGNFSVNRALFNLPDKAAPRLGDDVIIIGPGAKPPPMRTAAREPKARPGLLPPRVDIRLSLGDDFRFRGSGAALLLAGTLQITSGPDQPPAAVGTVRVVNGVYEAFGAKLTIDRGVIAFQGPFDNPGLNIIAMRHEQEVNAGVQVTGNVREPRVELISEPNLPEEEKLSWLVFGRGTASGGASTGQAQAALQAAGAGLLNKMGSTKLASRLGLDRLSLDSSKAGALAGQQVVSLGKEISNRLYVGYEQSITGISGVVKLTYELTRHWSIALLGGASTGLDVLYSNRFDSLTEQRQRRERGRDRVTATE